MTSADLLSSHGCLRQTFRKHSCNQPFGVLKSSLKWTLFNAFFLHPSLIFHTTPPFHVLTALFLPLLRRNSRMMRNGPKQPTQWPFSWPLKYLSHVLIPVLGIQKNQSLLLIHITLYSTVLFAIQHQRATWSSEQKKGFGVRKPGKSYI